MKAYPFLTHLSSFAGRVVVFLALASLFLFFFFLMGNYQDFLDTTQTLLLNLLRLSLLLQIVCTALYVPLLIYRCLSERKWYVPRWAVLLSSAVFSAALLLLLSYVQLWLPI